MEAITLLQMFHQKNISSTETKSPRLSGFLFTSPLPPSSSSLSSCSEMLTLACWWLLVCFELFCNYHISLTECTDGVPTWLLSVIPPVLSLNSRYWTVAGESLNICHIMYNSKRTNITKLCFLWDILTTLVCSSMWTCGPLMYLH